MQNPEDLVRTTRQEVVGREIVGETGPLEDLDVLSEELGQGAVVAPGGGEVVSHGGLGRRIFSVFIREQAGGGRRDRDRLLPALLLRRAAHLSHQPDQRLGGALRPRQRSAR